jgi:hypothetical protein
MNPARIRFFREAIPARDEPMGPRPRNSP